MSAAIAAAPCSPSIRALLVAQQLPVEDLDNGALVFLAAGTDVTLAGVVGLEPCGDCALLRSLAVDTAKQGRGLGAELVGAAERHAQGLGFARLYLLTTTAADFFARLGYARVDRAVVPPAIATTAQFAQLCPASAVVMVKALA